MRSDDPCLSTTASRLYAQLGGQSRSTTGATKNLGQALVCCPVLRFLLRCDGSNGRQDRSKLELLNSGHAQDVIELSSSSGEDSMRRYQQLTSHLRVDLPTGYTRPTLQQILKADRQVFMYLIRIGAQLKRLPDNQLDLDSKLFQALQSYEVGFHLLPLPKACRNKCNSLDPVHCLGFGPVCLCLVWLFGFVFRVL